MRNCLLIYVCIYVHSLILVFLSIHEWMGIYYVLLLVMVKYDVPQVAVLKEIKCSCPKAQGSSYNLNQDLLKKDRNFLSNVVKAEPEGELDMALGYDSIRSDRSDR